jgi:hypothetical protein
VAVGQPTLRSVDSQRQSRAIEPRDTYPRRAFGVVRSGAASAHRHGLGCWSRRGRRTRQRCNRVPQELGTPCGSISTIIGPGGTAKPEGPRPQAAVVGPEWNEDRRRGVVSPSEAPTKRGETVRRESERSIVPLKLGNPTAGTQWRKGGAVSRSCWEETWPVHRDREPCQANNNS